MSFPASEAQRFVHDLLRGNHSQLADGFNTLLFEGGQNNNPASADVVNNWLQNTASYNTDLNGVNAELTSELGNNLTFWQGTYNTQSLDDGSPGPTITIQGNNVTVGTTIINIPSLQNGVLSWSDNSNSSSARLELYFLTGIAPQLDPCSPSFAPPYTIAQAQTLTSTDVPNAYIGPQFLGSVWGKGLSQPSQANIQGRKGIFPPVPAQTSASGPLQASTPSQWAGEYTIWTKFTTGNGNYQASENTLVISTSGQVTMNNNAITSPNFVNGNYLQWSSDSGNSTSGKVWMLHNTTASTSHPVTGNQFYGYVWYQGDTQPTTSNWYGFANDFSDSDDSSGQSGKNQACRGMNEWAVVDSVGNQAIQICMQMQMSQMIMKVAPRVLSVLWDNLKAVFAKVREWYREMQEMAKEAKKDEEKGSDGQDPQTGTDSGEPASEGVDPDISGFEDSDSLASLEKAMDNPQRVLEDPAAEEGLLEVGAL